MALDDTQKPEFEEWLYWAEVVVDRLTICVNVYSRLQHEDIFLPEKDRLRRNMQAIDLLKRIHALTDGTDTPSDSLTELDHHAERVIDGLVLLFRETVERLPELAQDMQKLLKSSWHSKFPTRLAENLFRGPLGDEREGIGSGLPEHGRLPEALHHLLMREHQGDARIPRQEVGTRPHLQDRISQLWTDRNSRMLRSAGRIE